MNQVIEKTKQSLQQLCDSESYIFLDNTEKFLYSGAADVSLYKDNIHLNTKGGKMFGEAICSRIRNLLNLPAGAAQTSTGSEQNFQNGRISGRRMSNNTSSINSNNNNQNSRSNNNVGIKHGFSCINFARSQGRC